MAEFGIRFDIAAPDHRQALCDVLKGHGWHIQEDGAPTCIFETAQAAAEAFDALARSVGARPTERYVFRVEDDKFVPVRPVTPYV